MDYLAAAFLFSECKRWDVKGKSYFDYPNKYYCEDIGLRNSSIGFRQQEMTHIMENIIYNDLIIRGVQLMSALYMVMIPIKKGVLSKCREKLISLQPSEESEYIFSLHMHYLMMQRLKSRTDLSV